MSKSAVRKKDLPGRNVAAKSAVNRSIRDQGWHEIQRYRAAFGVPRKVSVAVAIRTAITAAIVKKMPIKLADPFTLKLV